MRPLTIEDLNLVPLRFSTLEDAEKFVHQIETQTRDPNLQPILPSVSDGEKWTINPDWVNAPYQIEFWTSYGRIC